MLTVLSPAKTLDYETPPKTRKATQPQFLQHAAELVEDARRLSPEDIQNLMGVSENIAMLNHERFLNWHPDFTAVNAKQALLAFKGDVYTGLQADTLDSKALTFAQKHLRILSGLYGLLRPLDLMQPYRLEMGTKFSVGSDNNLYEFWKDKVTGFLNEELDEGELFINLASNEYFSSINSKRLNTNLISPQFKDFKNGKLKIISFYAKKARGMMVRYLLELEEVTTENLLGFNYGGYAYSEENTTSSFAPVFIR